MAKKKRKLTDAERAELAAHHERVMANARRTRELAERAYAKLDDAGRAKVDAWRRKRPDWERVLARELAERDADPNE